MSSSELHVDVVVVSYNSHDTLRACVEPLLNLPGVRLLVVDNASPVESLSVLDGLPVYQIQLHTNRGFAAGTNAGWRAGSAPYVLILNPDARIDEASLRRLVERLADNPDLGAAAPRIVDDGGHLDFSVRRYPRLRATFAQALFAHRLFPRASWVDDVIRDAGVYDREGHPEWVSGACILLRRRALEQLGGLDERFFLYREDVDLCRRLTAAGWRLLFDPAATCVHEGGASGDRTALLTVFARSRMLYARKHYSAAGVALEWVGILVGAMTHAVVSRGGLRRRLGHVRVASTALRAAFVED